MSNNRGRFDNIQANHNRVLIRLHKMDVLAVLDLIRDEDKLNQEEQEILNRIKSRIIEQELTNLSEENVLSDIKLLMTNIPEDTTTLEKVRWLYINIGKLFSYDYRVANEPAYGYEKHVDIKDFVGRYQTCIQISEVLNYVLNSLEGVSCRTISRSLNGERGHYGQDHVANEVIIDDGGYKLKLLLDLTLDLYLIQADCHTMHFGYIDDGSGTYDIIPQSENIRMDKKLGFVVSEDDYTDVKIERIKRELQQSNFTDKAPEDIIDYKIAVMHSLSKRFPGYHEGKRYVELLFSELLNAYYTEYNLFYSTDDEVNLKSIYKINLDDYEKWIIYSNKTGFVSTSKERLRNMLDEGWMTNSQSLKEILKEEKEKVK